MNRNIRLAAAAIATLSLTSNAFAASRCARDEIIALDTAALQQELMVAALTCHQIASYNRFVLAYRPELQDADAAVQAFFTQREGVAAYHTFKTRLANDSSLQSAHDRDGYCTDARAIFDTALPRDGLPLDELVDAMPVSAEAVMDKCGGRLYARRD